jgi:hypothetical protein
MTLQFFDPMTLKFSTPLFPSETLQFFDPMTLKYLTQYKYYLLLGHKKKF